MKKSFERIGISFIFMAFRNDDVSEPNIRFGTIDSRKIQFFFISWNLCKYLLFRFFFSFVDVFFCGGWRLAFLCVLILENYFSVPSVSVRSMLMLLLLSISICSLFVFFLCVSHVWSVCVYVFELMIIFVLYVRLVSYIVRRSFRKREWISTPISSSVSSEERLANK